nr:hypothetical protein [Candidatus Sigynarchaeum springense]
MRLLKNAAVAASLCATLLLFAFTSVAGFVLDIPKARGVGNDPIKYSFELGADERISFFFESRNATVDATIAEIRLNGTSIEMSLTNITSYAYEQSRPYAWTLNVTINATAGYGGVAIDFYAKYTFMRTSGLVLSITVAIAAAGIGVICVYLLIAKRKVEEKT